MNLVIGASPDGGPDGSQGFFTGNLDETRVSNSAIYSGTSFPLVQNLQQGTGVGLWKFDDQTFNDTSSLGDHNDGVPKGGSIFFSQNTPDNPGGANLPQDVGGGNVPALTSLTPTTQRVATQGDSINGFGITGTNLSNALNFTTDLSGNPAQGITVSSASVSGNHDLVTANITVGLSTAPGAYLVTVPGSDSLIFIVKGIAPNPQPSLINAQLSQSSAQVETTPPPTVTITNGSNFIPGSVVRVKGSGQSQGSDRVTQYQSSTSIAFTLAQSDLEIADQLSITVFNPPSASTQTPNGGESGSSLQFTVTALNQNPVPTLTQLCADPTCAQPPTVISGTSGVHLRVQGSNFVQGSGSNPGSKIIFNGAPRADTIWVSSSELDLKPSASEVANTGTQNKIIQVTVNTPPPGGGEPTTPPLQLTVTPLNPIPTIASLAVNGAPPNVIAGGPQFTLQVLGTNFVGTVGQPPFSVVVVKLNGVTQTTTTVYRSATELDVTIPASAIQSPGQIEISVFTPSPGGGTSDPMLLTVNPASNPTPTVSTVSPTRAQVDQTSSQVGQVTVTGTGFMIGASRALVNGFPRVTNVSDSTHLSVTMLDSDFAVLGQLQIKVSNPEPGGGVSPTAVPLSVYAPAPTLNQNGISPTSATAGPNPVTITLTGTNFIDESTVLVNGVSRPAVVVPNTGFTQLQATLTSDVATGGTLNIQVSNPTTGGGGGTSSTTLRSCEKTQEVN